MGDVYFSLSRAVSPRTINNAKYFAKPNVIENECHKAIAKKYLARGKTTLHSNELCLLPSMLYCSFGPRKD